MIVHCDLLIVFLHAAAADVMMMMMMMMITEDYLQRKGMLLSLFYVISCSLPTKQ